VRVQRALEPVEHGQGRGGGLRVDVGGRVVDVGAVDRAPVAAQQAVGVLAEAVCAGRGVRHGAVEEDLDDAVGEVPAHHVPLHHRGGAVALDGRAEHGQQVLVGGLVHGELGQQGQEPDGAAVDVV